MPPRIMMTAELSALRHATMDDLPRIVEIYNAAIPGRLATADTTAVTVEQRMSWFRALILGRKVSALRSEGEVEESLE